MVSVVFTESEIEEIPLHQSMTFTEACQLTFQIEQKHREIDFLSEADFYVVSEKGRELYSGSIQFGTGYTDHLYEHIYKKLSSVEFPEEKERQKNQLLRLLEREVPQFEENEIGSALIENEGVHRSIFQVVFIFLMVFSSIGIFSILLVKIL